MASFSHPHHTHSLSYTDDMQPTAEDDPNNPEDDDDGADEDDDTRGGGGRNRYDDEASDSFASPPASSVRPPSEQRGLQPDPGYGRFGINDTRKSVGRFQIVEGSPSRGPIAEPQGSGDEGDGRPRRRSISPIAMQPVHAAMHTHAPSSHHVQYPPAAATSAPRYFSTPHFPSMAVNGSSVTLTCAISSLPPRGVSISPSASGLEFTPPKLKWTPSSRSFTATFTATPLDTAKEGRVKVCYIIAGDDASDYAEPPSTSFQMYSEDTPLPLPSPEGSLHSPTASDSSDSSIRGGGKVAAFLASGVPRQSGRFMVIDEELQASSPPPSAPSTSPGSGLGGLDNPFDLLQRLQASLSHLMQENTYLRSENERLVQENGDLRHRAGFDQIPDNRFNQTPTHGHSQHQNQTPPARIANIQAHVPNQQANKQRFATAPAGSAGVASRVSSASSHTSPPSALPLQAKPSPNMTGGVSIDKRQTLPANFVPRGSPAPPRVQSALSPNPVGSPVAGPRRVDVTQTTSPPRADLANSAKQPKSSPPPPSSHSIKAQPSASGAANQRRPSADFSQQIESGLTASLQASALNGAHGR